MLQKIKKSLLLILGLLAVMQSQSVNAKSNTKLIIENHFKDKILYFRVVTDPENLIDLDSESKKSFEITPNENLTIGVRADQAEPEAEAYLQTKFSPFLHTRRILKDTAFWGVRVVDSNDIDLSGYIAPFNMAYSWKGGAANVKKIEFCSPEFFIEHGDSCELSLF
jgi:hypothetical protein